MIVVTGAAGFIGSCVVARLNELGRQDILAVDHLDDDLKKVNLQSKKTAAYMDKAEFLSRIKSNTLTEPVECLIHMGACSSTTLTDAQYYEENNFLYSQSLAEWAFKHRVRFIYASSAATYGDGSLGYDDTDAVTPALQPLNLYGWSKQKFDVWVLKNNHIGQVVGLKFFNVFGPNEYHKADMRSVVAKSFGLVQAEGRLKLFKSYKKEYADGEQRRDFIYVKDAVDVVIFFWQNPSVTGIFNVGTGKARSWNDLARAIFAAVGKPVQIEYFDMPDSLREKYQYFTEANVTKLRQAGYQKPFHSLEAAVKDYVGYLQANRRW